MVLKKLHTVSGQVAAILILVSALGLVLMAVSMNFGRIVEQRTMTQVAATTGVAMIASNIASYGEVLSQNYLRGGHKKCGKTSVIKTILVMVVMVIVAIVGAILSPFSGGSTGVAAAVIITSLLVVLAVVTITLQAAVVQPMMDDLINRIFSKMLKDSPSEDFMARGMHTALQRAVSDQAKVPDLLDADQDMIWGRYDASTGKWNDYVERFAFYMNRYAMWMSDYRLDENVLTFVSTARGFRDALQDLVYGDDSGGWGFFDSQRDPRSCQSAECSPCCLPLAASDTAIITDEDGVETSEETSVNLRPTEGCLSSGQCGQCQSLGPYTTYPWSYDPLYPNWTNDRLPAPSISYLSFLEQLGVDDENRRYMKRAGDPNGVQDQISDAAQQVFRIQDATGFYNIDPRSGVFPFFYILSQWGVNLSTISSNPLPTGINPQCMWYDPDYISNCAGFTPLENMPSLDLPRDPASLTVNRNAFVDTLSSPDPRSGDHYPFAPDRVSVVPSIIAQENDCVEEDFLRDAVGNLQADIDGDGELESFSPDLLVYSQEVPVLDEEGNQTYEEDGETPVMTTEVFPMPGFWKSGMDNFCAADDDECAESEDSVYPYATACPSKYGAAGDLVCSDAATPNNLFREDVLDEIVVKSREFVTDMQSALSALTGNDFSRGQIDEVYRTYLADWIDFGSQGQRCEDCFLCEAQQPKGLLWQLLDEITVIRTRLQAWRDRSYVDPDDDCYSAPWCMPPEGMSCSTNISLEESAAFNVDTPEIYGDIPDIISCLNYTIGDGGAPSVVEKFQACADSCAQTDCDDLPRSVLSRNTYRSEAYVPPANPADVHAFLMCFNDCSTCDVGTLPVATPPLLYTYPPAPLTCDATTNQPTGNWYTAITNNIMIASFPSTSCDVRSDGWLYNTRQSQYEAENQVAKYRVRRDFLRDNLLAGMDEVLTVLTEADTAIRGFLGGPTHALIQAMCLPSATPNPIPQQIIYGWQDEKVPKSRASLPVGNPLRGEGYWHVVKVEARVPGFCDDQCGTNTLPHITTESHGFLNTKRCFHLSDRNGRVKLRVVRYDEDKDSTWLSFPGGRGLWDFRFFHPLRQKKDPSVLFSACANQIARVPEAIESTYAGVSSGELSGIYGGAFIMAMLEEDYSNRACWLAAHDLLSSGVMAEACAEYFFGSNMDFRFIPCDDF